jgi:hypothetical protein
VRCGIDLALSAVTLRVRPATIIHANAEHKPLYNLSTASDFEHRTAGERGEAQSWTSSGQSVLTFCFRAWQATQLVCWRFRLCLVFLDPFSCFAEDVGDTLGRSSSRICALPAMPSLPLPLKLPLLSRAWAMLSVMLSAILSGSSRNSDAMTVRDNGGKDAMLDNALCNQLNLFLQCIVQLKQQCMLSSVPTFEPPQINLDVDRSLLVETHRLWQVVLKRHSLGLLLTRNNTDCRPYPHLRYDFPLEPKAFRSTCDVVTCACLVQRVDDPP